MKEIDCNNAKQENKVKSKSYAFVKGMEDYIEGEQNYNRMYGEYSSNCNKLDEMMIKFKTYEDPINFYNLHMTADFTKNLDRKFHLC